MKEKELRNQVADAIRNTRKIKSLLKKEISSLGDNPNIERLGGNAFTISFSQIQKHGNLSPKFYDFKCQYEKICSLIDKTDITNLPKRLREILKEGKIDESVTTKGLKWGSTFTFHPDVISKLKEILQTK